MSLPERSPGRPSSLPIAGRSLLLPCFFPSVSGVKSNLPPVEYLRFLCAANHPQFLLSAYDIHHSSTENQRTILELVKDAGSRGASVLLDSGNYERYWMKDDTWTQDAFWSVLTTEAYPLSFSFDQYQPDGEAPGRAELIEVATLRDQARCARASVIPIVHARSEQLPELVNQVAQRLQPLMIAVAERELGDGVLARAKCVQQIRRAMTSSRTSCPLHLLGTGNPLSVLIYALAGADSFDGLEWCQTAVDQESALLYHFQQREFSRVQTRYSKLSDLPYTYATPGHNLVFYERWITDIRRALGDGSASELVSKYLPEHVVGPLGEILADSLKLG